MAGSIDVVDASAIASKIDVSGTGWSTDPVTIRVRGGGLDLSTSLIPDTGDIAGLSFVPQSLGRIYVDATDGTDTDSAVIEIQT